MSVVMIILGILMIILGVDCMATPISTFSALGWIVGVAVIIAGIASIFRYAAGKVDRSIWELIGGIVSIVIGIFITANSFAQFATNMVIAFAVALWLIVYGISGISEAVSLKKVNQELPSEVRTSGWLVVMILSVLMTVLGVACVFQPMLAFFSVGLLVGASILVSGIKTLVLAIQIIRRK